MLFNPFIGGKGVHTFLNVINPKVNVIARLEFELADFDVVVLNFSHYKIDR